MLRPCLREIDEQQATPRTLHEVNDRQLMLHRSGTGDPAVVFLPRAGLIGLDFWNVHDRASALTTSVLYDRAGTGWSDPVDLPRTAAEVTDELRDPLQTAGITPPYLLVGHSLGAAYARHYAQRFGDEVRHPFGARFSADRPFRPTTIRAVYADDEQDTVAVIWDGEGTPSRARPTATRTPGS
jgi:pimeloyl-ACP methyl ester carboxylesterase